jgi:hypothetical protein
LCDCASASATRLINRLRINLVILDPELEAKIPSRKLDYPGQLQFITRRLLAMPQTARVRIARQQVKRIDAVAREALRSQTVCVDAAASGMRDTKTPSASLT